MAAETVILYQTLTLYKRLLRFVLDASDKGSPDTLVPFLRSMCVRVHPRRHLDDVRVRAAASVDVRIGAAYGCVQNVGGDIYVSQSSSTAFQNIQLAPEYPDFLSFCEAIAQRLGESLG